MSTEASEAVSVIKKEQPAAEYTHCRSHILAITYTCKTQSIKKFMDILNSVCNFFENLPKNKVNLNLPETKRKEIIGLAKTRWVERYKTYDTYHLLICYKKQEFSLLSQSKKEIYMMSFTNI